METSTDGGSFPLGRQTQHRGLPELGHALAALVTDELKEVRSATVAARGL